MPTNDFNEFVQMADLEKEILRRGRAYQCLLCENYKGEKRHVIPHVHKYHIPLDSAPFYCSLCHFITTEKKKLQDHVHHYSKHVEAARQSPDQGKSFMHENKDPILLVEGSHYGKMDRKDSHDLWSSRLRKNGPPTYTSSTGTVSTSTTSTNSSGMTPDPFMATEPLEGAMVPLDDFLSSNPNFDFLDRILGYDSPENHISTQEKDHPADSKEDQEKENKRGKEEEREEEKEEEKEEQQQEEGIKKRKLENDSSEDSKSEDSEDEDTGNHKSSAMKEVLPKITQMNSHLFMIHDVLLHMMNEMKQQTSLLRDIRDGRDSAHSSTHWTENRRRSRSKSPRRKTPTRRRTPPRSRPQVFRRK